MEQSESEPKPSKEAIRNAWLWLHRRDLEREQTEKKRLAAGTQEHAQPVNDEYPPCGG